MKIDCHLHLPVREELTGFDDKKRYLLNELRANDIDYGIVIPDNVDDSPIGNLDQCINLFKDEKHIFLMASINVSDEPSSDTEVFDKLLKKKEIVGLKTFPGHDEYYPNDNRLKPFIELCLKHNVPFVIHTGQNIGNPGAAKWNDPKYIVELASDYPGLKIIICHYYWPDIRYCYETTRGYENIYFDISGLADVEVEAVTGRQNIMETLEMTISDNPKSVLFGSDFGGADIGSHIKLIEDLDIPHGTRELIYSQNAVDLFLLPIMS